MSKKWILPNWLKKYKTYIVINKSYDLKNSNYITSIKELESYMNYDYLPEICEPRDFLVGDRVQVQVKLLENLHKEGIL